METRGEYVRPCDMFEWTMVALNDGRFTIKEEDKILSNLQELDWIKQCFDSLSGLMIISLYYKIVQSIKAKTLPYDLLSISCMYYNFNKTGIDTRELRELINSGEYVQRAIEEKLIRPV
ncbi:MAG: hypothetical protein JXB49_24430 [Bacteroidales bacterium]|nr:hypothetical protein [Bacteroidales bacterium]